MKLVFAIVNNDDSQTVSSGLTRAGFSVTKLATTGGFLMAGNTTFLIGVEEERVEQVLDNIARHSRKRSAVMPEGAAQKLAASGNEVNVGGATVFVLDVEQFIKL